METSTTGATVPAVEQQRPQEYKVPPQPGVGTKTMKVLVAVDGSELSLYALRWALENYLHGDGDGAGGEVGEPMAMVTLVNVQPYLYDAAPGLFDAAVGTALCLDVVNPTASGIGDDMKNFAYTQPEVIEYMRKQQEESVAAILSRALQVCEEKKVKAETLVLKGDPKDMICQAAEEMHVDLLVVGSRGLGQIKRAFLGSVSDYCAHHVKCPILIVKPPKGSHK